MKSKNGRETTAFLLPEVLNVNDVPAGVDSRALPMRSAIISSAAMITGCSVYNKEQQCACSRCCESGGNDQSFCECQHRVRNITRC